MYVNLKNERTRNKIMSENCDYIIVKTQHITKMWWKANSTVVLCPNLRIEKESGNTAYNAMSRQTVGSAPSRSQSSVTSH